MTPAPPRRPDANAAARGDGITVAHVDPELGFSGGELQVFLLLDGLRARGHRNLLCCQPGSECASRGRASGFEVQALAMRNDLQLGAVRHLARTFRDEHVDLVHLHTGRANALGGIAARLAGVPAITTRRMDGRVRRHLLNRLVYGSLVRRAVGISPTVAQQLRAGGVAEDKIVVIPSTVDPDTLTPSRPRDALRAELGLRPDDVALLVLASLSRRKGIDVLLSALTRMQAARTPADGATSWVLLIAGDGDEREALGAQARAAGLDDKLRFLGRRDDAADLLAACDVLCMPSRREGLGIAALQAMAAGRPVLGSHVGGLADAVVHDHTGLLVPPEDVDALAAALTRLLDDAPLRRRLGDAGRAHVDRNFHHHQMVAAYAALYQDVLEEAARKSPRK